MSTKIEIVDSDSKRDTTITKVDSDFSPKGKCGQKYLASGKTVSMRLWENEPPADAKEETERAYETVGFVIKGSAELTCEGQKVSLKAGDSWVVPKGTRHSYKILEPFTAVVATSPQA